MNTIDYNEHEAEYNEHKVEHHEHERKQWTQGSNTQTLTPKEADNWQRPRAKDVRQLSRTHRKENP